MVRCNPLWDRGPAIRLALEEDAASFQKNRGACFQGKPCPTGGKQAAAGCDGARNGPNIFATP